MAELSQHPDVVDLAEYAEGLLDDSRRAAVDDHVRGCPGCSQTLSDLAALPQALAAAPLPPMPVDVAERLDRAIAAESEARASGWSGTAAQVTPMRPKRRWLAPVVAAAAVVGAVAVAVPVLNNDSGSDDSATEMSTGSESADREAGSGDLPEDGAPPPVAAPNARESVALSSDSFGRDVIDAFYTGSRELRASKQALASGLPSVDYYAGALAAVDNLCDASSVPDGMVDAVTYDDEPARLLRQESGKTVDAIAFTCEGGEPALLDAATLRPRS